MSEDRRLSLDENKARRWIYLASSGSGMSEKYHDILYSWGGESLCNRHEDDAETGPSLKAIGISCIVGEAVDGRLFDLV